VTYASWQRTAVVFPWRSPVGIPMETLVKRVRFVDCDAVPVEVNDDETPLAVRAGDLG
jgi:hypothetical protein